MADVRPPLVAELVWSGDLRFDASSGTSSAIVDGDGQRGPSPMQHVAIGLAGCMAADVVDIIRKGRHPLTALRVTFTGTRAEHPPLRASCFSRALQSCSQQDLGFGGVERLARRLRLRDAARCRFLASRSSFAFSRG